MSMESAREDSPGAIAAIVDGVIDGERDLSAHLDGQAGYRRRVRQRLIPHLEWVKAVAH